MNADNAVLLPNVVIAAGKLNGKRKADFMYQFSQPLEQIMWKVVSEHPMWEFKLDTQGPHPCNGTQFTDSGKEHYLTVNGFLVFINGQEVGRVSTTYARFGRVFDIRCPAIEKARQRRSSLKTGDAKKALVAIHKNFAAKTVAEIVKDAKDKATQVINNQTYRKNSLKEHASSELSGVVVSFAFVHKAQDFAAYATANGGPQAGQNIANYYKYQTEMLTVDQVRDAFNKEDCYVVLIDQGRYVVKKGTDIQIYEDATLPEVIKAKLGMLKLVEAEQMVTNVGCRVNAEVFVLLPDTVVEIADTLVIGGK